MYLKAVVHKTYISVDENGTEAAVASGAVLGPITVPPQVNIDQPFIFLIRDIKTGSILFMGRVLDPTK